MGMDVKTWVALLVAALCEVGGDYAIRVGRLHPDWRLWPTAAGMVLLAAYGIAVTYWWEGAFGKLLGVYVAVFFLMSQAWGAAMEGEHVFAVSRIAGGILIVARGALIQWGSQN
ncbi:MAG TPA: hypothetical protein VMT45_11245 [Thermoanaerobaculaceae bacterium]|nr:hypothetical protein [Thermoanaerobaculaceae bacterium]